MSALFRLYPLARQLLFSMDAEQAHDLTLKALRCSQQIPLLGQLMRSTLNKPCELMGLTLRNPVGLAAGLDKNGAHIDALGALGFGFVEVGTVTPLAQTGNPKPRLFRLPQANSLINRFGFNNDGLEVFIKNVQSSHYREQGGILGLNIGKNAATPIEKANDDYLICLRAVYPHADYVTINISSPNTQNLRSLQGQDELSLLLASIQAERRDLALKHGKHVPVVVKIAPDLSDEQIDVVADALTKYGINGVIATNTTLSRQAVQGMPHAQEQGGLSGPPVHALSLHVISRLRQRLGADFAIIGVGGIESGQQAREKMQAGANAVQLYTGLIYKGPALIQECLDAL